MSKADKRTAGSSEEEVVTYPFGPPEPAPRAPRVSRRVVVGAVTALVVLGIVGAVFAFGRLAERDNLAVGDCATFESGLSEPYRKADCADDAAAYVLLEIRVDGDCVEVPGAVKSMTVDGAEFCFGDKGVDPATTVNAAREGDCVAMVAGEVTRTPCASAATTHIVSRRLTDLSAAAAEQGCANVEDLDVRYGWSWSNVDTGRPPDYYDVVLCLSRR
jgi:hypothetical protein